MMLYWGLERAKAEVKDVWLIAQPGGMPLYEANGFRKIGSVVCGPEHCLMVKENGQKI